MSERNKITSLCLREIARCLDIPVEEFLAETNTDELLELIELQRLCSKLKTPDGRAAAQDALHRILEREGSGYGCS
jgi:hypothetical protein